jgi:hypothetical protein
MCRKKSRGTNTPSEQLVVEFTTVKARGDRIVRDKGGEVSVKIAPGEVCLVYFVVIRG